MANAQRAAKQTSTALTGEVLDAMPQRQILVPTSPYLTLMDRIVDKGGDLTQLSQLLELNLRWEANEARKAYVAAMAAFKAEPMEIRKRKTVSFRTNDGKLTEYTHAELSDVTDVVVPNMGKHGLSHRWDVTQKGNEITVACTITHALGHSESVSMTAQPDGSGKKNAIQQVSSTVTYLERYTLLALTGMATKGMDDDGRGSEGGEESELTPEQIKEDDWIRAANQLEAFEEYGPTRAKMLKDYDDKPSNIPNNVRLAFNAAKARVTPKDEE